MGSRLWSKQGVHCSVNRGNCGAIEYWIVEEQGVYCGCVHDGGSQRPTQAVPDQITDLDRPESCKVGLKRCFIHSVSSCLVQQ